MNVLADCPSRSHGGPLRSPNSVDTASAPPYCGDANGLAGVPGEVGAKRKSCGGGGTSVVTSGAAVLVIGICSTVPHSGHFACLPAVSSLVRSSLLQLVQRNSMGIAQILVRFKMRPLC